jgi:hypothetical protein
VDQLWLFLAAARLKVPDLVLLDSGEEEVPFVAADSTVELLRRVVSTESFGLLVVPDSLVWHASVAVTMTRFWQRVRRPLRLWMEVEALASFVLGCVSWKSQLPGRVSCCTIRFGVYMYQWIRGGCC